MSFALGGRTNGDSCGATFYKGRSGSYSGPGGAADTVPHTRWARGRRARAGRRLAAGWGAPVWREEVTAGLHASPQGEGKCGATVMVRQERGSEPRELGRAASLGWSGVDLRGHSATPGRECSSGA